MADFRFEGVTVGGRAVQGVIDAGSQQDARKKVQKLAERHKVKVSRVLKKRTFSYTIEKDGEKIKGEQKAYSREEVRKALEKLGCKIIRIQPKLLDFTMKPPPTEIVTFVRVSADLLRENLPFTDALQLLINDIDNVPLRNSIKQISNDLRKGMDSEEAFRRQEKMLGRFTARMLGLASKSGNMSDIYESTAKFLERNLEFKRNLKSALIMPFFTILILMVAVMFYLMYIFPETATLIKKLGTELPPMTAAVLDFSDYMKEIIWLVVLGFLGTAGGIAYFLSTDKGKFFRDKFMIRMPILGTLIHKTTIEIFCRVFYSLYNGSGENIETIKLAAEACDNKYMEAQIKNVAVPMMLSKGKGLVEAFEASGVFTKTALTRFKSGAETGTVKETAQQIANYYERETVYKLKNTVEFIQIIIAMFITIVITALTMVSSETAMITPKTPF